MTFRPPGVLLVALDSAQRERSTESAVELLQELAGMAVDRQDPAMVDSVAPSPGVTI